jgi:hypothetical protein
MTSAVAQRGMMVHQRANVNQKENNRPNNWFRASIVPLYAVLVDIETPLLININITKLCCAIASQAY